jgi:hypothetical protein
MEAGRVRLAPARAGALKDVPSCARSVRLSTPTVRITQDDEACDRAIIPYDKLQIAALRADISVLPGWVTAKEYAPS